MRILIQFSSNYLYKTGFSKLVAINKILLMGRLKVHGKILEIRRRQGECFSPYKSGDKHV